MINVTCARLIPLLLILIVPCLSLKQALTQYMVKITKQLIEKRAAFGDFIVWPIAKFTQYIVVQVKKSTIYMNFLLNKKSF